MKDSILSEVERLSEIQVTASDLLVALFRLLEKHHVDTIGFRRIGCFRDGLEGITGRTSISLADSLRNYAATAAKQIELHEGIEGAASSAESLHLRCFAQLLDGLIADWEEEGSRLRQKGFVHSENVIR